MDAHRMDAHRKHIKERKIKQKKEEDATVIKRMVNLMLQIILHLK